MASLKGRFEEEVWERLKLLSSSSPLLVSLKPKSDADEESLADMQGSAVMHPQLQCDFEVHVTRGAEDIKLQEHVILTEFNSSPSKLGWDYMNSPILLPIPNANSTVCSLTMLQPSAVLAENFGLSLNRSGRNKFSFESIPVGYQLILNMYEDQFSKSGLLATPDKQTKIDISVNLLIQERYSNYTLLNKDGVPQPIFSLYNVKFGTPEYLINPVSDEVMGIRLPFVYSSSQYIDFNDVVSGVVPIVVNEIEPTDEQFTNRKSK